MVKPRTILLSHRLSQSSSLRCDSRHGRVTHCAPVAPIIQDPAHRPSRAGSQRGFLTRAPLASSFRRAVSRLMLMRPIPIAALALGMLQSSAAFCIVLMNAPAGGAAEGAGGDALSAIRVLKLHGARTLSAQANQIAPASGAGIGALSMGAAVNRGFVLREAGTHSDIGGRS